MADATELDLDAVRETWLNQCGPCDAGLPMACVCSDADPRPVIERLLAALDEAEFHIRQITESRDRAERSAEAAESSLAAVTRYLADYVNGSRGAIATLVSIEAALAPTPPDENPATTEGDRA